MDKETRNKLRSTVVQCRKILEEDVLDQLEGAFGIHRSGTTEPESALPHLDAEGLDARRRAVAAIEHIQGYDVKPKDAVDQFQREVAFTHLNRLCAFKMLERRGLLEETVSRGFDSNGFKVHLAEHPEDERLWRGGDEYQAYRHFLFDVCAKLTDEIKVLFDTEHISSHFFPGQRALQGVLDLINADDLADIWESDETIGWIYQYFTPKELREKARKESAAPRNSYELAFRNQFYTPRYVVQFLTDNTLGRTWYEMRKGETRLVDQCEYMVRRPTEIFLGPGEKPTAEPDENSDLSKEDLLKQPVHIMHREKKLPWEIKVLDPASGSGHFLLYSFDLLETIYDEAYDDPDIGDRVHGFYPSREDYNARIPVLILRHNLHGIDIDLRSTQIAALALWMRAQRSFQRLGLQGEARPPIEKVNIVCAEPMPGDEALLDEFCDSLSPSVLGDLVRDVWQKMKLAGEAGSLLKIEEEIREVVRRAQEEWKKAPKAYRISLFEGTVERPAEQADFDFTDFTAPEFWDKAEALLIEALERFAGRATNGASYGRRLFRGDAEQGFAFIDLCRERYDVVLMNPPFGAASPGAKGVCEGAYPESKADLGMAFVDRGLDVLDTHGIVGAITTRILIANDNLETWRERRLISGNRLRCLADLGYGVLDDAMVEAAIYTVSKQESDGPSFFVRALDQRNKEDAVLKGVTASGAANASTFWRNLEPFTSLPSKVLCYWLPQKLLASIPATKNLVAEGGSARHGLQTTDDFRFLRLAWEVSPSLTGRGNRWVFFAKGGEYQPYWDDLHLVINWADNGAELKEYVSAKAEATLGKAGWSRWINAWEDYFRPGLTFPERTTSDFSPRVLSADCIFSATGEAIFFSDMEQTLSYLLGSYTRPFKLLVDAFVGSGDSSVSGSAANHYRSGLINSIPPPCTALGDVTPETVMNVVSDAQRQFVSDDTSRIFIRPSLNSCTAQTLVGCAAAASEKSLGGALRMISLSASFEAITCEYLGLTDSDNAVLELVVGRHPHTYPDGVVTDTAELARLWTASDYELVERTVELHGPRRQLTKKSYYGDRRLELVSHALTANPAAVVRALRETDLLGRESLAHETGNLVAYLLGAVLGRWDVRVALDESLAPELPDVFGSLPICPPGTLFGTDGLPARPGSIVSEAWMRARPNAITLPHESTVAEPTISDSEYPLHIDWDGVLVDDQEHEDDIVRRVRDVIELLWKGQASAIEREACEILKVKELREHFRNPKNFWDNHLKRYSKSRRKAPIYWLLQSPRRHYALWVYYHRLDKDIFFKALRNYVDPKLNREQNRLRELRDRHHGAAAGREQKLLEKQIDDQETVVNDVMDFRERLEKVAALGLDPDLNDGVILNIAPLHELVPWKEPKAYWDELLAGKYEWSTIGKQMRNKGLVRG